MDAAAAAAAQSYCLKTSGHNITCRGHGPPTPRLQTLAPSVENPLWLEFASRHMSGAY